MTTPRRSLMFKLAISTLIFLLGVELAMRVYFYRVMPAGERNNILFVLWGDAENIPQRLISPNIIPYLWSNYRPNPESEQANSAGWRYGGGPKTNAVRILCIGGSTTWSVCASNPTNSYPAQLETYLRAKGFSVDVVNGGCPYYTTAEMIGALAFRGIYTEPDIVLIHEGWNDTEPLLCPKEYQPDYSHWRFVDKESFESSRLYLFRQVGRIPSFGLRIFMWKILRPNPFQRQMLGAQTNMRQDRLATNDVSARVNYGYRNNLITLAAICRAHGATPVFITFNAPPGHSWHLLPEIKDDPVLVEHVESRARWAMNHNNGIMMDVGSRLSIPVIPFHLWSPSREEYWLDHCHLSDEGCREKGEYIGSWLIQNGCLAAKME